MLQQGLLYSMLQHRAANNRDDVDFDNADDLDPVQEWTLPERNDAQVGRVLVTFALSLSLFSLSFR
jgi:hypothetical protein